MLPLLFYHSFTGWGCRWFKLWQLLAFPLGSVAVGIWAARVGEPKSQSVQYSKTQELMLEAPSACEKTVHELLMTNKDDFGLSSEECVL